MAINFKPRLLAVSIATIIAAGCSDSSDSNTLSNQGFDDSETITDMTSPAEASEDSNTTLASAETSTTTSITDSNTETSNTVNHAPSFNMAGDHRSDANSGTQSIPGWASQISDGDDNTQGLKFLINHNSNAELFSEQPHISYPSGTLRYTAKSNQTGSATLSVLLMDDGGTANGGIDQSPIMTFSIRVTPPEINNAPRFIAGSDVVFDGEGEYEQAGWATAMTDGDGGTQNLSFEVSNSNPALFIEQPWVSYPSGSLRFTAAPGASGDVTLTIVLKDNGGTDFGGEDSSAVVNASISLTANAANPTPDPQAGSPFENQPLSYHADWPQISSAIPLDPAIESAVASILAQMTLEEKVGQMIQPNLDQVTPEEAKKYKLGSLLNGGGSWPNGDKHATAADWASQADEYWNALEDAYANRGFRIPFMWATDAVHGHNNVFGATVFPHNIGLGAANDPELVRQIGQATAKEVVATGLDWTFAPTVAAPRNLLWGRTYEGYSEDPEIIFSYAGMMVDGLQGNAEELKTDHQVISTVKHWVGDGGTANGVDRGVNAYSEEYMINLHATGYFSGLRAGAQVVMSSFNSWDNEANYDLLGNDDYNKKLHGSKYLITDVLKNKMGFDGLVVTDWNGHGEINGCSPANCAQAVLAGNDVFMVPSRSDWIPFYENLLAQVNDGVVPLSRINDAVTRILRVKMRAGLWDKPQPTERTLAGDQSELGNNLHRGLAREAVRKSLVLLKNEGHILPLSDEQKVYITGSAANDLQKQTGGWTLTWQGTENTADDLPGATTVKQAVESIAGSNVIDSLSDVDENTIAIVAIGEDPYAEFFGDIKAHQTLGFADLKSTYAADLQTIRDLTAQGIKVVTVFFSGRPMYVNEEINRSDAFVAAWLPGTEATGITDVLYAVDNADFTGRLPFTWPSTKCGTAINRVADNIPGYVTPEPEQDLYGEHSALFQYGYGLSYADSSDDSLNTLSLDERNYGCGQSEPDTAIATSPMEIYNRNSGGEFKLRISGAQNGWAGINVSPQTTTEQGNVTTSPINYQGQYDAVHVTFDGGNLAQIYLQYDDEQGRDSNAYLNADSTLQFDIKVQQAPTEAFNLAQHCVHPCLGEIKFKDFMPAPSDSWNTLKVPLQCFSEEGMNFSAMNTPLLFFTGGEAEFDLGNVRIVPRSIDPADDALTCEALGGVVQTPLDDAVSYLFASDAWEASIDIWTAKTGSDWSPVPDMMEVVITGADAETEVSVTYSNDSDINDKGLLIVGGQTQNISNYIATGTLDFDLFVNDYAENTEGLVVKMESSETGPDYFIGSPEALPAGEWHSLSIPVANLGLTEDQTKEIIKPFVILPAWSNSQLGVSFKFKNVRLIKN